jgi:hypothetical protein
MLKSTFQDFDIQKTEKWFKDENGKSFLAHLKFKLKREQSSLESSSDLLSIGRAQGKIEVLRYLINVAEEQ